MPVDAIIIAPLSLAVVLAAAAVGKLRARGSGAETWRALGVPERLSSRTIVTAHPWVEVALAVLLVVASGWIGLAGALAATALTLAYLWLIVRAVRKPEAVDCDCFGAGARSQVTSRTVVRNSWYVALAIAAVSAQAANLAPITVMTRNIALAGSVLVAGAVAAVTIWLTLAASSRPNAGVASAATGDAADDYVRVQTPAVPVTLADGSLRSLRDLSRERAQLLLFVSTTCGMCRPVLEQAPQWRGDLSLLDVRLVFATPVPDQAVADDLTLYDPERWARQTLGIEGNPSAVLLGVDGQLAGGPVAGAEAIDEFVAEIRLQLTEAV